MPIQIKDSYKKDRLVLSGKTLFRIIKGTLEQRKVESMFAVMQSGWLRDVHRAYPYYFDEQGGYAAHEAEDIVRRLSESGRYQKDVVNYAPRTTEVSTAYY